MNQGVARGFVFGKDIISTFGLYASIKTQLYDPATDRLDGLRQSVPGSQLTRCYFYWLPETKNATDSSCTQFFSHVSWIHGTHCFLLIMADPGFAAIIDVFSLSGPYTLGLARLYKENLRIRQQFKLLLRMIR